MNKKTLIAALLLGCGTTVVNPVTGREERTVMDEATEIAEGKKAHEQVLAYVREQDGQRVLCVFNFSDQALSWALPEGWAQAQPLPGSGLEGARLQGGHVELEPWGGLFATL